MKTIIWKCGRDVSVPRQLDNNPFFDLIAGRRSLISIFKFLVVADRLLESKNVRIAKKMNNEQ